MRLKDKVAIITGSARGIGQATAWKFAAEGAKVVVCDLERNGVDEVVSQIIAAGGQAIGFTVNVTDKASIAAMVKGVIDKHGRIDVLVNNAARQNSFNTIEDISDKEWELTFATNISAMFYLTKAAVAHMRAGSSIINTASVNSDAPNPHLLAYATTKGAIQNFTAGLAQLLAEKGIRANAVAPGPIWTPLIPSTLPEDSVKNFGKQVPMKRPGQPVELATAYVMLADPLSSYVSGATIAVTGGKPFL